MGVAVAHDRGTLVRLANVGNGLACLDCLEMLFDAVFEIGDLYYGSFEAEDKHADNVLFTTTHVWSALLPWSQR